MKIPKHLKHQEMFFKFSEELGLLAAEKNDSYGDAFQKINDILKVLYPNGIPVSQYFSVSLLIRMLDKVCRITGGKENVFNEDAWNDLCGYALVGKVANHKQKEKEFPNSGKITEILNKINNGMYSHPPGRVPQPKKDPYAKFKDINP